MLGDHLLCFGLNPCFENGSWGGGFQVIYFLDILSYCCRALLQDWKQCFSCTGLRLTGKCWMVCLAGGSNCVLLCVCSVIFSFPTVLNIICFMCIMCICMFWCVCVLWKKEKNLKQSLLIIVVFQQFTKHQTKTLHQSIRIYISWRMTTSWASWKYCNNGFTLLTFWWLVNSL